MSGEELSRALSGISDDKIEAAVECVTDRTRPLWMRVAVSAAVLVLLISMMFYWGGSSKNAPFVSVIVYADSGNGVEIKLPEQNSALSNVTNEGYFSNPPSGDEDTTRFSFRIQLKEYEKQYIDYKVYRDGEEVIDLKTKELFVGTAFLYTNPDAADETEPVISTETIVWGNTEKETEIAIHYLKEGGELLLKCVIRITPQEEGFLIVLEEVYTP